MVIKNLQGKISIINIVIILGLILLAYLSYTQYLADKIRQDLEKTINFHQSPAPEPLSQKTSTNKNQPVAKNTAPAGTSAPGAKVTAPVEKKEITPAAKPGYYQNYTYFYQISFPENWPIKIRSAENVSLGTVPPKDGQGAITIEVVAGENSNEIEQAKAEAAKYPGLVSLTEKPFTLAGVTGTKITLNNFMAKAKNIYILLMKNGLNYIIKYSEESVKFSGQTEQALSTFKFTK